METNVEQLGSVPANSAEASVFVSLADAASRRVSFEEYVRLDLKNFEWKDGKLVEMAAASYFHEDLFRFLFFVLNGYVHGNQLGKVLGSRFAMRLETLRRGREPDILFVRNENLARIKRTFLDGAADMAVEITSPESFDRDRGEKFLEYEAAGIIEYWLIDPERRQAEFYRLDENGRYQLVPIERGVFRSQIVEGFWLKIEWLWQLPGELDVLRELQVI